MWALVTPSARQCGPPELLATLPPIEHVCWLLGSGAKCSPCDGDGPGEVEVEHAGLDPRPPGRRVDRQDAVHLRRGDHDRAVRRHGAAGQPGARAAGDERHAVAAGDLDARLRPRPSTTGSRRRRRRPPCARRRGGTATARSSRRAPGRRRAPGAARRRARLTVTRCGSGRRIRMTRPDSTGSPSTSSSSPGWRWSPRRTRRPSRSASSSRSRTLGGVAALAHGVGDAPAGAADGAGGAAGDVRRRQPARRGGDLALGVAGAGGAGGDAADEPDGAAHHAPRRSRRTARDVPVARPAALIIGTDSVVRARVAVRADRLGRAEHPVEAGEVGACLVDRRRGRRRSTSRRSASSGAVSARSSATSARSVAERVAHPHERHGEGGERQRAQHDAGDEQHAHRPSRSRSSSPVSRAFIRSAISCSWPWRLGSVPAAPGERVGQVLLVDPAAELVVLVVMRVLVAGAVAEHLGALVAGVAQVRRHLAERAGGDVGAGRSRWPARCGCSSAPSPGGRRPGPG